MGWTHYWVRPIELDPAEFEAWVHDVERMCAGARKQGFRFGLEVAGESVLVRGDLEGFYWPRVAERPLWLDGKFTSGNTEIDAGEFFGVAPDETRGFCKTGGGSYDMVVRAALVLAQRRWPRVRPESDGGPSVFDEAAQWLDGTVDL